MTWLNPIILNPVPGQWTVSSVIENDFVKISHQTSGLNNSFFTGTIAQAEIDDNQKLTLYDFREVKASDESQAFHFAKPDCFKNRRIAFNANPYALLVSGQIWDWSLLISEFSGSTGGTTTSTHNFASVGDANGIIYAIGTNKTTTAFTNPSLDGRIVVTSSSIINNNPFTKAFGRVPGVSHSSNGGSQFLTVDFGSNNKIKVNKYIIQGRDDFNGHHLRTWELRGSDDAASWVVIDSQIDNSAINQSTWFTSESISSTTFYRYLRLALTGANASGDTYLTMGQMEFYGALQV